MLDRLQTCLLRLLRVPPEPEPPFGAPSSVRVFRASRKLYYLRLVRWVITQLAALVGILFWFGVIAATEHEADRMRANPNSGSMATLPAGKNRVALGPLRNLPPSAFKWLWAGKVLGVIIYAGQLVVTFIALRMDYHLRWYIVTDRSLRIRFGVWNVHEVTMSYANLQQVMISQGPLERLLGISNVRVESAGGGKPSDAHDSKSDTMHSGVFHGVDNAEVIRDLIIHRLRQFRETGLGDPDERRSAIPSPIASLPGARSEVLLASANEVLTEARALRIALTNPGG